MLKGVNRNDIQMLRVDPIFLNFIKKTTEQVGKNDGTKLFNPIDLSMIASSASKIGRMEGTEELFAAFSKQSKWIMKNGKPQEIANIATAYSKLEIVIHKEYFAAISD